MSIISTAFLISHGANAIIAALLVLATLYRFYITKIRLLLLMTLLMVSWMITNFLLIIPLVIGELNISNPIITFIASWNIIGSAIVPSVFILFIDAFEGSIDQIKTSLAMATIGAAIFIALSGLIGGDIAISSTIVIIEEADLITMRWSPLSSLAIFPTVIICGIWTQRELKRTFAHAIDTRQIRQLNYMKYGSILMFFIGPAFGILGVILVDGFQFLILGTWASEIVGYLFVSVGIFMVSLSYITSEEVAFLQPQRIDSILVIYDTGIPIYNYDFDPDKQSDTEISLVSGAMTAITALMGEAFNVSSDVREISFHDKELLLEFTEIDPNPKIAFILITGRASDFLRNGLDRFKQAFVSIFSDRFEKQEQLRDSEIKRANLLVNNSFGLSHGG